jgi:hypothetical protein
VGLTGGNPEVRGQTAVKASKATTNYESGYFPKIQKITKQNSALLEWALNNGTVTIFLVKPDDASQSYYLGCYSLDGFSTHKESIDDLRATAASCSQHITSKNGLFTRFQERTHVRVKVKPYSLPEDIVDWKKIVLHDSDIFPIGVEGKDKGEPSDILGLTGEKVVSFEEVTNTYLQKGFWRDLAESDANVMDDVTHENAVPTGAFAAGKRIKICVEDFLTLMVCVAVGVFCRLKRLNVLNNCVTPLRNNTSWFKKLGSVIQTYATPHPGRVYDLTPLNLILSSHAEGQGRKERHGLEWMAAHPAETKEFLFAAILATTTGRMGALYQWTNFKKVVDLGETREDLILFPKPDETDVFIDFMNKTCPKGKIGAFLSDQFKKSLPLCVESVEDYSRFLKLVAADLDNLYRDVIENLNAKCKKECLVQIMQKFLVSKVIDGGNLPFVSSQIIYNLDEMINLIPGTDWETVEMGFGSKEAMLWLMDEANEEAKMQYLKNVKEVVMGLDEENLLCLGLKRIQKGRKVHVFWAINERDVGLHEIEHFVCKLWIVMVRMIGARPSKNPKLHRPHLHPLKANNRNGGSLYGAMVEEITDSALDAFRKGKMCIPQCFQRW